jgi:molybdopterin/thiamine biosynthesis adenylyltransferase/rhodanese-related sulfurtransferase
MSEFDRYSRQVLVKQIGPFGQHRLLSSNVLIVGAGGLGCQVAAALAGAGVGKITIIDHDKVSLSNLHRQILFRESDIDQPKASIAVRELTKINSEIQLQSVQARLALDNAKQLISDTNLVIDAADNFATSYILSDACLDQNIPLLSASVNRTFGYLGIFCASPNSDGQNQRIPSFRAVFPRLSAQQQSCDTVGVSGPSVGIIGNLQAQEAIKILTKDKHQLSAKILYCDLWNYSQHIVDFSSALEPTEAQIQLLRSVQIAESDFVIDVRNTDEVVEAQQPFKVDRCVPISELDSQICHESGDQRIVLACQSGQRAILGAQRLLNIGMINVAALIPDSNQ